MSCSEQPELPEIRTGYVFYPRFALLKQENTMAKIWKVPSVETNSLPIVSKPYIPNNQFFSLFKKSGKNVYTRVSEAAYSNGRIAGMVFRNAISADPLNYSIRPCKIESLKAQGVSKWSSSPMLSGMTK